MNEPKETCYSHLSGDDFMEITACERWSIGLVWRLKSKYSDEVEIIAENPDGSLVAQMPYKWMKIRPPRKLSDEEKAALAKRFKTSNRA
jgi:hypothetical protein